MNLSIIVTFHYGILSRVYSIIYYSLLSSKVFLTNGSISGLLLIFAARVQILEKNLRFDFCGVLCLATA
jgi:uncharacterized membrane protein (UPF0136 family)